MVVLFEGKSAGVIIAFTPSLKAIIPKAIMMKLTTKLAIYSILAWPKGWFLSAGLPLILNPNKEMTQLAKSDKLFTASAIIDIFNINNPIMILLTNKIKLEISPKVDPKNPYFCLTFEFVVFL